ncbi:MAG: hypothetical protein KKD39_05395 [Candidatus Altiarchaeota archaeon]|nr:hypothetical protein [Candidatus Altiarchaeota archaeon]
MVKSADKAKKGIVGIGALIIFIAIVLVGAVVAAVFIASGGSLQTKAYTTGNQAREGVTPGIDVIQILGSDPSSSGTPHQISRFTLIGRLPPGGEPLSFNSTVINIDTPQFSQTVVYEGIVDTDTLATGTSNFVVTYVKQGPNQINDYLTEGDLIRLKFNLAENVGENLKVRLTIMPVKGSMSQIEFLAPDTLSSPVEPVWPTA